MASTEFLKWVHWWQSTLGVPTPPSPVLGPFTSAPVFLFLAFSLQVSGLMASFPISFQHRHNQIIPTGDPSDEQTQKWRLLMHFKPDTCLTQLFWAFWGVGQSKCFHNSEETRLGEKFLRKYLIILGSPCTQSSRKFYFYKFYLGDFLNLYP